jgi:hypothetical protein
VSRRARRAGCVIFGLCWVVLFMFTNLLFALGDCVRDPQTGQCEGQPAHLPGYILVGELLLLVVAGWLFYRREMKDDEF